MRGVRELACAGAVREESVRRPSASRRGEGGSRKTYVVGLHTVTHYPSTVLLLRLDDGVQDVMGSQLARLFRLVFNGRDHHCMVF